MKGAFFTAAVAQLSLETMRFVSVGAVGHLSYGRLGVMLKVR